MGFTVKQLEESLTQWEEESGLENNTLLDIYYEELTDEDLPDLEGIGQVKVEDTWGGEGDGAEIHVVISVGDRYFQADGYYSSWGETTLDGALYEVKPKQVLRTEYEAV